MRKLATLCVIRMASALWGMLSMPHSKAFFCKYKPHCQETRGIDETNLKVARKMYYVPWRNICSWTSKKQEGKLLPRDATARLEWDTLEPPQ